MVISGIYVETLPGQVEIAATKLAQIEGVEVHHIQDHYKIILTLETPSIATSLKTTDSFKEIEQIQTTCLVYTNFENQRENQRDGSCAPF